MKKGQFIQGALFALSLAICLALAPAAAKDAPDAREISAEEAASILKEKPDETLVLDVRTPAEFKAGHLPGAKNMDFFGGSFDVEAAALPKDKPVLVYCRSGKRSAGAVEELRRAGVGDILHLSEGLLG